MKFGKQFEFHKIPEWIEGYLDYTSLKKTLKKQKKKLKEKQTTDNTRRYTEPKINGTNSPQSREVSRQPLLRRSNSLDSHKKTIDNKSESKKSVFHLKLEKRDNSIESKKSLLFVKENKKEEIVEEIQPENIFDKIQDHFTDEVSLMINEWAKAYQECINKVNEFYIFKENQIKEEFEGLKSILTERMNQHHGSLLGNDELELPKSLKKLGKIKEGDELGYAVSWKRAFTQLYSHASWLHGFSNINYIASQKIIKKYSKLFKEYPLCKEMSQQLLAYTKKLKLIENDKNLVELRKLIVGFYAKNFTNNDIHKAKDEIKDRMAPFKPSDIGFLCFYIGVMITLVAMFFILLFLNINKKATHFSLLLHAYNFSFNVIVCFFGVGFGIWIFNKYRINYIYVLDINPELRLSPEKILKTSCFLMVFWLLFLDITYFNMSFHLITSNLTTFIIASLVLPFIFLFLVWPFHCFYLTFRFQLFVSLVKLAFPIRRDSVRFRDGLFGDILTSLTRPFQSLYMAICFSMCSECISELNYNLQCNVDQIYPLILTILPFIWRFFQNLNRFYYTKNAFPHLANALKYLGGISYSFFLWNFQKILHNYVMLTVSIIATAYLLWWDIYMDWSLGDFNSKNFYLRDKIHFPKPFYYYCIVQDIILRYTWLYNIYIDYDAQTKLFILSILEVWRRMVWSFIRIENENQNDPEKYRAILEIPQLPIY